MIIFLRYKSCVWTVHDLIFFHVDFETKKQRQKKLASTRTFPIFNLGSFPPKFPLNTEYLKVKFKEKEKNRENRISTEKKKNEKKKEGKMSTKKRFQ